MSKRIERDAVFEADILKFYYVRSLDAYWIGQRVDNFYYAEYFPKICQWVWTHSRYLPWGERVVSPTSAWKEHTYPSEPEEVPFKDWLQGFIKKYITAAADVRPVVPGRWELDSDPGEPWRYVCNICGEKTKDTVMGKPRANFCPNCGADMRGGDGNG